MHPGSWQRSWRSSQSHCVSRWWAFQPMCCTPGHLKKKTWRMNCWWWQVAPTNCEQVENLDEIYVLFLFLNFASFTFWSFLVLKVFDHVWSVTCLKKSAKDCRLTMDDGGTDQLSSEASNDEKWRLLWVAKMISPPTPRELNSIPSGKLTVCYWTWPSRNSGFSH